MSETPKKHPVAVCEAKYSARLGNPAPAPTGQQEPAAAEPEWNAGRVLNRAIAAHYGLSLDITEDRLKKFIIPREAVLTIMEEMAAMIGEREDALAAVTLERDSAREQARAHAEEHGRLWNQVDKLRNEEWKQVGWMGPYGIVPGGMDNAPHPNFRPIYARKSDYPDAAALSPKPE